MKHAIYIVLDDKDNSWLGSQVHLSEEAAKRWIQDTGFSYDSIKSPIVKAFLTYGEEPVRITSADLEKLVKDIRALPRANAPARVKSKRRISK